MNSKVIKTEHGEIEYTVTGNGQPILFIHGGHSNCYETLFQKGFDLQKFQLITPSRPGYGRTPLDNNKTPQLAAGLIIELLDFLKIDKTIVYGISAGGLTAIDLAGNYPERIEKLILASAVSKKWLDEKDKIYKTAKMIFNPKIEGSVWGIIRFFSALFPNMIAKNFYQQFTTNAPHQLKKEDVKELILTFKHFRSKTGFLNDIDQMIDESVITKIQCPVLIIHSYNDNSVSFEHALHSHRMIKNSVLEALKNEWGHLFWIGNDSNDSILKTIRFIEER